MQIELTKSEIEIVLSTLENFKNQEQEVIRCTRGNKYENPYLFDTLEKIITRLKELI